MIFVPSGFRPVRDINKTRDRNCPVRLKRKEKGVPYSPCCFIVSRISWRAAMKSSRISAGTMIRSRLELTFSVIRTTLPRAFCLRSRKNVLRSAMIFSVQMISSSTAVIFLRLNEDFRIELPLKRVNVLFTPLVKPPLQAEAEKYRHFSIRPSAFIIWKDWLKTGALALTSPS